MENRINNKSNALHNRRSIRLKGYDYAQAGLYFITIVTQDRRCLFGEIIEGQMKLNNDGSAVEKCWYNIPSHFPNTKLHEMVVMPNHFHGIIEIVAVGAKDLSPNLPPTTPPPTRPQGTSKTIGSIIRGFKIGVTKIIRANTPTNVLANNYSPRRQQSIWQRNYWEHIIRNDIEYDRIARYIINNAAQWEIDKFRNGHH